MAIVYDHSSLVTVLKNTSGGTKKFGFIPPHGKELEANEEINVLGDIREAVNRGDRFGSRHMQAFLDALDNGLIQIQSTPAPIFYDETLAENQIMGIDNGAVTLNDPSWETSLSET